MHGVPEFLNPQNSSEFGAGKDLEDPRAGILQLLRAWTLLFLKAFPAAESPSVLGC